MINLVGQTLGRYHITEQLGEGGMATVYRAYDTRLDRDVAVKVIRSDVPHDDTFLKRFEREAKALARLSHPNIVKILDYGEFQGSPFLVMEFISGGSLKVGTAMPWQKAAALLALVAQAMEYVHNHAIIHRDIKPANILINELGMPLLSDFGIAKIVHSEEATLTGVGVGVGTPAYMAPEQGMGVPVDRRIDIYALGVVLYELVTGRQPYKADTPLAVILKHINDPLPSPRLLMPDLPEALEKIIYKAMAKKPEDRYQTMGEFASALEGLLQRSQTQIAITPPQPASQEPATQPVERRTQPPPASPPSRSTTEVYEPPPVQPAPPAAGRSTTVVYEPPQPVSPVQAASQPAHAQALVEPERKSSKLPWIIALVVVALLAVAGVIVAAIKILPGFLNLLPAPTQPVLALVDTPGVKMPTQTTPHVFPTQELPLVSPSLMPRPTLNVVSPPGGLPRLRVSAGDYPRTLDPQTAYWAQDITHLRLMYEGLTRLDENAQVIPGAAERWNYNDKATELVLFLRKGLRYSDGAPLNAMRFKFAILRAMDPATQSEYAFLTEDIIGAAEWSTAYGKKESADVLRKLRESVRIETLNLGGSACKDYGQEDCLVLRILFKHPTPYFHAVLASPTFAPTKEESIRDGSENWWQQARFQVSNGPFVLSQFDGKTRGLLLPNPNYWGGQARFELEFHYLSNPQDALKLYLNGDLDWISLNAETHKTADADPVLSKEKLFYPTNCTSTLLFNQKLEPFTDSKVRSAFTLAIDRKLLVRDILTGFGWPTQTWIPRGIPGYDDRDTRFGFDPARAKELLAQSSFGGPAKLPQITASFDETQIRRWEWLAVQFKNLLGVSIKLNPIPKADYFSTLVNSKSAYQLFSMSWCSNFPDLHDWLTTPWKTGGYLARPANYSNADFDKLVLTADSLLGDARNGMFAKAQTMLMDSIPGAFLWNTTNACLVRPFIKGIVPSPYDSTLCGEMNPLSIRVER